MLLQMAMVLKAEIERIVKQALAEDIGARDITTAYVVAPAARAGSE